MRDSDLERLKAVGLADVYKGGQHAAVLDRRGDVLRFVYRSAYLEAEGEPVATTLPATLEPVALAGGAVPPFFAGLLPEGRRLTNLRRAVKTSADDELSLLLAVGRDTIGDVQVVPAGEPPESPETRVVLDGDVSTTRFADVLSDAGVVDPVGLPGVQEKASARMISVPVHQAGERYLLKVDPPEYPHVVENEALFLALAREVGVPSAEARVVRDAGGRAGLLVKRFDRVALPDGGARSLACEDACQVLARWPADKYALSAEDAVLGLARHCPARTLAVRDLYRQLVFAWLTGNGDVHAKNLSILRTEGGEWRVSPAYDLPATVPYGDRTLALSVQGRTEGVSRRRWLAFAEAIGLPSRTAVRALDELLDGLADLVEGIQDGVLPLPQRAAADWAAELRHRHRITRGDST